MGARGLDQHSLHPVPPNQGILERIGQSMAAVKRAGHVRRRERNNKLLPLEALPGRARLEEAAVLPPCVPRGLDSFGVVCLEVRVVERVDDLLLAGRSFVLVRREGGGLRLRDFGRRRGGLRGLLLL